MTDHQCQFVPVSQLEIGMYVYLDLGWTQHPFSLNSFKIRSRAQIEQILSLGVDKIRYSPQKSDPISAPPKTAVTPVDSEEASKSPQLVDMKQRRRDILEAQQANLDICEQQFNRVSARYKKILKKASANPDASRSEAESTVNAILNKMTTCEEVAIRLLSEKASGDLSVHPINTTIISLLLGKACGMDDAQLRFLGLGALLHDIGKMELPERLRWSEDTLAATERKLFRRHVAYSIELAKKMQLPNEALRVLGQHHEHIDGSGYPLGLQADKLSLGGKILAVVNRYDNLCNPSHPGRALTPHDALALMFAKHRAQFDPATMAHFIRMMGVYPPGSVVQLNDQRYALVTSVNSMRPLKPQIVIYNPKTPPKEALIIDLESEPELGIQTSLKPQHLPRHVYDYLSPRKRICYFFERAREIPTQGGVL